MKSEIDSLQLLTGRVPPADCRTLHSKIAWLKKQPRRVVTPSAAKPVAAKPVIAPRTLTALEQYNAIVDPAQRSAFYKAHRHAILTSPAPVAPVAQKTESVMPTFDRFLAITDAGKRREFYLLHRATLLAEASKAGTRLIQTIDTNRK